MKGIIFTVLNDMVEEKLGLDIWDQILEKVNPPSKGIYSSGDTYPDEELFSLVGELSSISGQSIDDLVYAFGDYTFGKLAELYPNFLEGKNLKTFLQSVHDVIHVEVKKLYSGAGLPEFEYEDPGEDQLVMIYRSPKKLCRLGEGLMDGAAKYFGQKINRNHSICCHKGDDHCRFELSFESL